jgi:Zn-dependent protease
VNAGFTHEVDLKMKCQFCEEQAVLPFKCQFCKNFFCVKHRLPENHSCSEKWKAKIPRRKVAQRSVYVPVSIHKREKRPKIFWFSFTELKHLLIGVLLVMGVGSSISFQISISSNIQGMFVGFSIIFAFAFLLHELSHKIAAQMYGLWAEFRVTTTGALITLLSIVSPFKIVSPGAVITSGPISKKISGTVSLAGPLTNLMLSIIFIGITQISSRELFWISNVGGFFNAFTAFFNLLPVGLLDGSKVIRWNNKIWGLAFALSIILSIWSFGKIYLF